MSQKEYYTTKQGPLLVIVSVLLCFDILHSHGWSQTHCMTDNDLEHLVLLPPPPQC